MARFKIFLLKSIELHGLKKLPKNSELQHMAFFPVLLLLHKAEHQWMTTNLPHYAVQNSSELQAKPLCQARNGWTRQLGDEIRTDSTKWSNPLCRNSIVTLRHHHYYSDNKNTNYFRTAWHNYWQSFHSSFNKYEGGSLCRYFFIPNHDYCTA